ncbi:SURF1 family protein [Pseudoalteromonas sp. OOF1S-7]|uniref:SURF1 family protein n=1 Tax=Pseudoalteromonas sp. OOF1S-7 TaxID=2917757 RepID=UPI001EF4DDA5|nr:SURF1 family protein [Pseudoalteromonas sp. OOF1S-7]MCG7537789.1 SURF1 family protein [Pseudoalteromonas sp. OOF1S-7]
MSRLKVSAYCSILAVSVVVCTCLALSVWQWKRAAQKEYLIEKRQSNQSLHEFNALEDLQNQSALEGKQYRVRGYFETSRLWLLDNQILSGVPGYDVVTLFRPIYGEKWLVVNLGFIPAAQSRAVLPQIELPTALQTVDVEFKIGKWAGFTLADRPDLNAAQPELIQYLDHAFFVAQTQRPIASSLAYASHPVVSEVQPHYEAVVMGPDKHRAYAVQWLLLAVAAVIIPYFAYKRKNDE